MKTFFFFALLCHAAFSKPVILEAYGDSLTAGFLAGEKNLEDSPTLPEVSKLLSDLALYLLTGEDKYRTPHEYPASAWPARLAKKLKDGLGVDVEIHNYGMTGADTILVKDQLKKLPDGVRKKAIAVVFIGHNDFADGADITAAAMIERHRKALNDFFSEWDKAHLNSNLFLIPVGEVYRVYQSLRGYKWYTSDLHAYTCEDSWDNFFPYSRFYAQLQKQGKLESFFLPRLDAFHKTERRTAWEWNWLTFRNTFYVLENKKTFPYVPENFAVDCFHLASNGQEALAQIVYQRMLSSEFDFPGPSQGASLLNESDLLEQRSDEFPAREDHSPFH